MNKEAALELLAELGISGNSELSTLSVLSSSGTKYIKDLKMNFKTAVSADELGEKDAMLTAYAAAVNAKNHILQTAFKQKLEGMGATADEIAEAAAIASLLSANNILYRFRHFCENKKYGDLPARVRMNIMMAPVLGKELFELISLAVSAINGCEACVNAHEHSVRELGSDESRIFAAIRVAAVVASIDRIVN